MRLFLFDIFEILIHAQKKERQREKEKMQQERKDEFFSFFFCREDDDRFSLLLTFSFSSKNAFFSRCLGLARRRRVATLLQQHSFFSHAPDRALAPESQRRLVAAASVCAFDLVVVAIDVEEKLCPCHGHFAEQPRRRREARQEHARREVEGYPER